MNCVIFGAGAWGTAMAIHLARQGHTVTLVPRRLEHALSLASARENTDYLPGHRLDESIQIGLEPLPALMDARRKAGPTSSWSGTRSATRSWACRIPSA